MMRLAGGRPIDWSPLRNTLAQLRTIQLAARAAPRAGLRRQVRASAPLTATGRARPSRKSSRSGPVTSSPDADRPGRVL